MGVEHMLSFCKKNVGELHFYRKHGLYVVKAAECEEQSLNFKFKQDEKVSVIRVVPFSMRAFLQAVFLFLILCGFTPLVKASFLGLGSKVGPGSEIRDYHRGLSLEAPTSEWNVSISAKLITLNHSKYYDVYVSLQESIYRSQAVERVFESRKKDLIEFDPSAVFLVEKESLRMAGVEGLSFTYQDVDKGKIIQEILFVHQRVPYHLTISANIRNIEKLQDEINGFISSVKAIPKKKKRIFKSKASLDADPSLFQKSVGI